jgi:hypothetical protein
MPQSKQFGCDAVIANKFNHRRASNKRYAQFRASELFVEQILTLPNLTTIDCARSLYDSYFEYGVGEVVKPSEYDPPLDIVSGKGIHYFHSVVAALCFGFLYRDVYEYYDGIWYNFNYNGRLISVHQLERGRLHGKQVEFQQDGTIVHETFVDDADTTVSRLTLLCPFADAFLLS